MLMLINWQKIPLAIIDRSASGSKRRRVGIIFPELPASFCIPVIPEAHTNIVQTSKIQRLAGSFLVH